jgi:Putative zinc-finger
MSQDRSRCALGLSRQLLSAWRDRLLPEADAQRISLHVMDCAACQHRLEQFAQIAAAIQRQPPPDLRARTWRGIQGRLSQREQQSMRIPRAAAFSGIGAVAVVALIVLLFVVVLHQPPSNSGEPAAGSSTATAVAPTATGASNATSCADALPGAGPASAGPSFADLPLPANSVSTAPAKTGGGGAGQFTLYQVQMCTADSSPSAVNAFFAGLTSHGWLHSNTFPADGAYQSACANATCWAKDVRYVMLQQSINDLGGGVERYQLTIATAPPAPDCSGSGNTFSQGNYYSIPDPHYVATNVFANIPLPPLSRIVPDDAAGGQRGYEICSAGTVASITSYMSKHLSDQGWTSTGGGNWTKSGYNLTLILNSPTAWVITWRDPDFHA